MSRIKLFCIPYAGGSSSAYNVWSIELASSIQIIPVELTSRGKRFNEEFYNSIENAVEDIFQQIDSMIEGDLFALWGHSMGGLIAYELCHYIKERGYQAPVHLLCSGITAPHLRTKDEQWHQLEDEKLLEKIKDLEGTPKEFFEQKELVDLYLPIIRNDLKIVEQYQFKERVNKLNVDISIMYGDKETFKDTVLEWEKYTLGKCNFYEFSGGHFFLFEHINRIAELVNETLKSYLAIKNGFITGGN